MTNTKFLMRGPSLLSIVIVLVLLQGCTSFTIPVRQDSIVFQKREDKIRLNVGLFLTKEVRNYVITGRHGGADYNFQVGEALEQNALASLKEIFQAVYVIPTQNDVIPDTDRIISIKFGPSSSFKHGAVDWASEHTATTELLCEVYNDKWNLLWDAVSLGTETRKVGAKRAVGGLLTTPIGATYLFNKKYGEIFNKSLVQALEKLNDEILTSGRDAILYGEDRQHLRQL